MRQRYLTPWPQLACRLSRRMRLAAREWLWRIQIATSTIRSKLTAAADGGRSAPISARAAGSCRKVRNASQVQPGTPTAPMTTWRYRGGVWA